MTALILGSYLLTVARITRFITTDKLSEPARSWLMSKLGPDSLFVYGLHCSACMSVWVAAALTPVVHELTHLPWLLVALIAGAASHLTILLTRLDYS